MAGAITITDRGGSTSDLTTYTLAGINFGSAAADRIAFFGVNWREASSNERTLNSATIGGAAADILGQIHFGNHGGAIIAAPLASGTTATVELVFNNTNSRLTYSAGRAVGIDYGTNGANMLDIVMQGFGNEVGDRTDSMDIDTVDDGIVFAHLGGGTTTTLNMSYGGTDGLTADAGGQGSAEVCRGLGGSADTATGQTPRDIDAVYDTGVADTIFGRVRMAVSFGPAAEEDGALASAGAATAAFIGSTFADGVFSSAGVATVNWSIDGVFAAAGVAAVTFVGSRLVDGALAAAGIGDAAFIGLSAEGVFSAAGVAAVSWSSLAPIDGFMTLEGLSEALFVGELTTRWTSVDATESVWTSVGAEV